MAEPNPWKLKALLWALAGATVGVTVTVMCAPSPITSEPLLQGGDVYSSPPPGAAFTSVTPQEAARGRLVELRVEDASHNALPIYPHQGERIVLGRAGERYTLRVFNRSGRRVEVLPTVDGRSVLTGRPGDFEQRGYVVPAYDSIVIDGFRDSQDTTRAFRFSTPERAYSALKGTPQHVGVIGLAVFEERSYHRYAPRARSEVGRGDLKQSAPAPGGEGNLGTAWGEQRWSPSGQTSFVRAGRAPAEVLSLRYDNQEGLRARGIWPQPLQGSPYAEPPHGDPLPFPGDPVSWR